MMHVEDIREYCLGKKGVLESFPFGDATLVFKVGEKLFLLINLVGQAQFNAKCDPERSIELQEEYEEIKPGFHMNKKHWITVSLEGRLSNKMILEIIDHSYSLVFESLPKKSREEILSINF